MPHILAMSFTSAAGITALFLVDLLDMFFLSMLGTVELAAAVGYAGTVAFFTTSFGIGLSISSVALISKAIGANERSKAERLMVHVCATALVFSSLVAGVVWLFIPELLSLLGAQGKTHALAVSYLNILIPSLPFLALAMCLGAGLRAVGDGKRAMYSTIMGGLVNAILDPIFIFTFDLGVEGAAISSVFARVTMLAIACWAIVKHHKLYSSFHPKRYFQDLRSINAIAIPAILTNIATPTSNAFVTKAMAEFNDDVVAGYAVIGRLIPVLFGVIFALSGAVAPIVGQNFGAGRLDRVRESLNKAILFCIGYISVVSLLFFLVNNQVIDAFKLIGEAGDLVRFFSHFVAITFIFNGILFVANASFNNLGKPTFSTIMSWGKATLGTVPFIWLGAKLYGAEGVLLGQAIGGMFFTLIAIYLAYYLVDQKQLDCTEQNQVSEIDTDLSSELNPLSSSCAQVNQLVKKTDSY
ncbi:MATE family efflux transporter [Spartinivicinus ruber]|uniref:MATE family efflux transporter n=1 Tax=Spartinivicinus ruber TaxID=2683272 RepID=UPI001E643F7F|nr:MATE family efflux transporter [Spartinivicinus ruber]